MSAIITLPTPPMRIPPIRVLNSRFVEGTKAIEHLVQLAPDGVALPAVWMSDQEWKALGTLRTTE